MTDIHAAPGPAGPPGQDDNDDALNRERIEREAQTVDAEFSEPLGPGPGPGAGPVPLAINVVEENAALLSTIITVLSPVMPFLAQCYPPSTVNAIAAAYTAVEVKRGWNLRRLVSEEGALLMVAAPPTITAIIAGRQHFARLKAAKEAAEAVGGDQAPAPAAANDSQAPAGDKAGKPAKPVPHPPMTDGVTMHRVL